MANITSAINGLWSSPATWVGGVVPTANDNVNINNIVEVDGFYSVLNVTINTTCTLRASRIINNQLTLTGNLTLLGVFDYGTSLSPIPSNIKAGIIFNCSSSGQYGLTMNYGLSNKFLVKGATKQTNTRLSSDTNGTSFSVSNATGWKVGDIVMFGDTQSYTAIRRNELRTIATIDNVTGIGTVTTPFNYLHNNNGYVSNFTKNVYIKGISKVLCSYINIGINENSLIGALSIENLECQFLGSNANQTKYGFRIFNNYVETTKKIVSIISDCTFRDGQKFGYDIYHDIIIGKISNCCTVGNSSGGAYIRAGTTVELNACNFYDNIGVLSSWSEGFKESKFNKCIFNGFSYGMQLAVAQGGIVNDCVFNVGNICVHINIGVKHTFNNCSFGTTINREGFNATPNNAFNNGVSAIGGAYIRGCFINTINTVSTNISKALTGYSISISDRDNNPILQENYTSTGKISRDNTIFKTGIASLKFNPTSSINKVENKWDVFAPNDALVVVSGYIMKNTNYGNTNLPTVKLSGLGITVSTYTMSNINNTWEQFVVKGTQVTGNDGTLELSITGQSSNVGASFWVDGIVSPVSVPVNSGDLSYWSGGSPARLLASNFTSGKDVWGSLVSDSQLTGSMGELLSEPFRFTNVGVDEYITENAQSIGLNASTGRNIILRIYKVETPNIQIGPDIQMIEHTISSYTATINWTSLGTTLGYHILVASSGIQKATALIDLHSDKLENRVWNNQKALTVGKFIALK